jgi:DNA polymerase-1
MMLIFDASNVFIRSYSAYPSMTRDGDQIGGCVGFLKTMTRLVRDYKPEKVFIVWESGGSAKRRSIFKEYKEHRRPEKLNRYYEDDIPDSDENYKWQMETLIKMLKNLPACQVYTPDCEGDDVIAYLCKHSFIDIDKMIVSSDRDMYQLLDEHTSSYDLHSKSVVTDEIVFKNHRVRPFNFALVKALTGDKSDNIPGIKGVGPKTVCKLFPQLGNDDKILVQDIIDYSASHRDESKMYARVYEGADILRRNWKLVQLDSTTLSFPQAQVVDNILLNYDPVISKLGLVKDSMKLGIERFNIDEIISDLKYLVSKAKMS